MPKPPRVSALSESVVAGANNLLAGAGDDGVAERAVQAIEQLTNHLTALVGETGVRALLARSVALSSADFPWLSGTVSIVRPVGSPWAPLGAAMEGQESRAIREGFAVLLSTFIGLLGRLIGEPLVARLLHDLWPGVFPEAEKEPT